MDRCVFCDRADMILENRLAWAKYAKDNLIFMANLGALLGTFIAGADIIRQMVRY